MDDAGLFATGAGLIACLAFCARMLYVLDIVDDEMQRVHTAVMQGIKEGRIVVVEQINAAYAELDARGKSGFMGLICDVRKWRRGAFFSGAGNGNT